MKSDLSDYTFIVPPRREIEMLRKYYRNEASIKNEYSQARIMGSPR